jgi:hypothetical protein
MNWEANFLRNETVVGAVPGAGVAVWSEAFSGSSSLDHFLSAHGTVIYTVVAPIDAAMLGFILAAAAIIVTAASADQLSLLRESAHYDDLWQCFRSAMLFLGLGTIVTVAAIAVTGPLAGRLIFAFAVILSGIAALRVARSVWAVNWVIRIFTGPPLRRAAGQ